MEETTIKKNENPSWLSRNIRLIVIFSILYVCIVSIYFFSAPWFSDPVKIEETIADAAVYRLYQNATIGEVGDYLTGFISPLAFFWFVITVFLQKQEFTLQRKSLDAQVESLKAQLCEMKQLTEANKAQAKNSELLQTLERRKAFFSFKDSIIQDCLIEFVISKTHDITETGSMDFQKIRKSGEDVLKNTYDTCIDRLVKTISKETKDKSKTPLFDEKIEKIALLHKILSIIVSEMDSVNIGDYKESVFNNTQEGKLFAAIEKMKLDSRYSNYFKV